MSAATTELAPGEKPAKHPVDQVPPPGRPLILGLQHLDLPSPVIGGAATVMFALVTAIGIKTLNKTSFDGNHNLLIVAVALSFGLIPVIQPSFYMHFPQKFQVIFGSSITSTVIVVFILNLVFNHCHLFPREREGTLETALEYGAVAPEASDVAPADSDSDSAVAPNP